MSDLTPETLAELRRDAESWHMLGGERVLPLLNALDVARAERDALAAAVERVRALHVEQYEGCCNACDSLWPCDTIRALDESEANK